VEILAKIFYPSKHDIAAKGIKIEEEKQTKIEQREKIAIFKKITTSISF
jgi:hypothetical protein